MKIVIDIPEHTFNHVHNGGDIGASLLIENAIKNGIPLPKGHGRLGDLDALETEMVNGIHAGNCEEGYEKFTHINNRDDCVDCVRFADTIIEANKESEVKE